MIKKRNNIRIGGNIYIVENYKVIGMSAVGKYKNEFRYGVENIVEK